MTISFKDFREWINYKTVFWSDFGIAVHNQCKDWTRLTVCVFAAKYGLGLTWTFGKMWNNNHVIVEYKQPTIHWKEILRLPLSFKKI